MPSPSDPVPSGGALNGPQVVFRGPLLWIPPREHRDWTVLTRAARGYIQSLKQKCETKGLFEAAIKAACLRELIQGINLELAVGGEMEGQKQWTEFMRLIEGDPQLAYLLLSHHRPDLVRPFLAIQIGPSWDDGERVGQQQKPASLPKPKALPPAVQKAGKALESALSVRDELAPEEGKPPSEQLWNYVCENSYSKGKGPSYETFCRYIRRYYQDGEAKTKLPRARSGPPRAVTRPRPPTQR